MSITVEIAGQAAHVSIEVLGYENPDAQNPSDANWLTCRVEVAVRGFVGRVDAAFTTQDFIAFGSTLRLAVDAINGGAAFETDEDALRLSVEFNLAGTATITGSLCQPDRPKTSLTFSFQSDQSYLRGAVNALDDVIRRFPIRT